MRQVAVMERLSRLPRKMANIREHDILPDCVLYELASNSCFNCSHAAYLAYNPDFHVCKGIAGISQEELHNLKNDPWKEPHGFESQVRATSFNKKVRATHINIPRASSLDTVISTAKQSLGGTLSHAHTWDLHNGNMGIFLYTPRDTISPDVHHFVPEAACLLGFCGV